MEIGERIKNRRKELGLSQIELAARVGYTSRSSIAKVETNANGMKQSKIIKFADALDVSPAYLMGWEDKSQDLETSNIPQPSIEDKDFFKAYNKLNTKGKQKVREYTADLSANTEYTLPDHGFDVCDERPLREAEYRIAAYGGTINQEQISPASEEIT